VSFYKIGLGMLTAGPVQSGFPDGAWRSACGACRSGRGQWE
jgi:hypothetical protein